jgi:membrane protease YdiL (CAAX protease family)
METQLLIALVLAITATQALVGVGLFTRAKRQLAHGDPDGRMRGYVAAILSNSLGAAVVVGAWLGNGGTWEALGVSMPEGFRGWAATGGIVVLTALFVAQNLRASRDPDALEKYAVQFRPLEALIPHDDREQRRWVGVSVAAGLWEELVYRGFALAVLADPLGIVGAVVVSSACFGLLHTFQGVAGVVRTGVMGLVFAGLYTLSGSLLGPVVLHIAGDIATGVVGRAALTLPDPPGGHPPGGHPPQPA